mmetsp:Transcript_26356/g.50048  ORF Transcript_26356/g.50048 Transcript_26356/m.50048 type:complete len:220 (-) Transcript_26356:215-874(-)
MKSRYQRPPSAPPRAPGPTCFSAPPARLAPASAPASFPCEGPLSPPPAWLAQPPSRARSRRAPPRTPAESAGRLGRGTCDSPSQASPGGGGCAPCGPSSAPPRPSRGWLPRWWRRPPAASRRTCAPPPPTETPAPHFGKPSHLPTAAVSRQTPVQRWKHALRCLCRSPSVLGFGLRVPQGRGSDSPPLGTPERPPRPSGPEARPGPGPICSALYRAQPT